MLAGGSGVARAVVEAVFAVCFCYLFLVWSNYESVQLTAERLG